MKKKAYQNIYKILESLFSSNPPLSFHAKMSLSASVLTIKFKNWIFYGFYVSCNDKYLEIGPYHGKILPCTSIKYGKGVCGTSALNKQTITVKDIFKYKKIYIM